MTVHSVKAIADVAFAQFKSELNQAPAGRVMGALLKSGFYHPDVKPLLVGAEPNGWLVTAYLEGEQFTILTRAGSRDIHAYRIVSVHFHESGEMFTLFQGEYGRYPSVAFGANEHDACIAQAIEIIKAFDPEVADAVEAERKAVGS